ncbi:Hypothetical protein NGAL_HAMBI2605_65780 [Neorhizobium galegae bv. orientalis]|nr:Hypothetical protein NGAL_HAMBI2605_65780 [Neorhizobium galegae bv. orientalis]
MDSQNVAVGGWRLGPADGNIPVTPQIADAIGVEPVPTSCLAALTVENAGNDRVGIMGCQSPQQRQSVFVGTNRCRARAWQGDIEMIGRAAFPAQRQTRACLVAVDMEGNFLDQRAQQFLGKRDFPYALTSAVSLDRPRLGNDIRLYWAAEVLEKLNGSRSPMSAASSRCGNSASTWRSQVSGSTPQARQVSIKL